MAENKTPRDEAWLVIIEHLQDSESLKTDDVVGSTGVHARTARAVLRVAEGTGVLSRHSARAHTWCPIETNRMQSKPTLTGTTDSECPND